MAKLYYGNGNCSIDDEGAEIMGIQITYRGMIELTDQTSDSFFIGHKNNKIIIVPINFGTLNNLFDYKGEIKIKSVMSADNNANKVITTIHRVMDYAELITSNAEDITNLSEDLISGYTYNHKVNKQTITKKHIENLRTSNIETILYLQDGTEYNGYFHIHIENGMTMTGNTHDQDSRNLFINRFKVVVPDKLETTEYKIKQPKKSKRMTRSKRSSGQGGY